MTFTVRTAATLSAIALVAVAGCGSTPTGTAATSAPSSAAAGSATSSALSEITITHPQGSTVVPLNPTTVVTFDMASLDTLDALGVEVAGLPKSNVPASLSKYEADAYTDVGTLFEPDYEAVDALAPDLIIVANRSASAYPELAKIAPTIDVTLDWEDYLPSFRNSVTTLASIFDAQDEATTVLAAIDTKIAAVKSLTATAGTGLIVLTSAGEITAFGPGSRFGWLHDALGMTPAIADVEAATHGDPVSNEFILETNPDWLFVVDRDAATGEGTATAEQILDNEVVAGSKAWSSGQVVYLDPIPWYIVMSGVGSVNAMLDQISDGLQ